MDIGIHVSLWTPEWDSPFLDSIDLASELGFSCVEIPLMDPQELPLVEIGNRVSRNGLKVYCGTGLNPATDIGSDDEAIRENGIRHLRACIKACSMLGSDSLGGVIHSPWGKKSMPTEAYSANATKSFRMVAEYAESLGIALVIECINRYENSFINTVNQGLSFLRDVGKSNVGLHLDTFHMNIEEQSIPGAIIEAGSTLKRIHLSENNRGYPGNGALRWREIIQTAMAIGYKGPWIIESYVDPSFPAGADVNIWRQIEPDMSSSLRDSLFFLKGLIAES
jgi:D-psicose/D-tagatose/L-ribulose 3-epimerase